MEAKLHEKMRPNRKSRADSGGLTFPLSMAMEEDKAQRKQAEEEGVFLGFGDDLTIDDNSHRAFRIRRKPSGWSAGTEGSRKEIANGFVQNAGANPSRRIPAGIR